ncbi:hypothetical protein B484DRAFT_418587 [Ochromonadaceae sp. CCMP2298]|nr:hypothetical protein B484DRAFT_418587 [Ochromonadaceae sp. CCMP2298]
MATFEVQKPPYGSIGGKIEKAADYKNQGNECFKEGAYKKAMVNYSKGLAFTKGLPGRSKGMDGLSKMAMENCKAKETITPEQDAACNELEVILKTNIATCCLRLDNPQKALIAAKEALDINPSYWKGLLRKAEALLCLKDLDRAAQALTEAAAIAPEEAFIAIKGLKERLAKQRKVEVAQQRKAFGNIFATKGEGKEGEKDGGGEGKEGEGKDGEGAGDGKEGEEGGEGDGKMDDSL